MLSNKSFLVLILSLLLAFAVSCSKKQTVKSEELQQEEPVTETDISEEIPAVEEEPVAEEAVAEPEMPDLGDGFFDFDRYNLKEEAKRTLEKNAEEMKRCASVDVIIEGHCDERGTEDYNIALGEKRAKSARDYLVSLGIPSSRIIIISYGETRPFDSGHSESAWAKNRRAHFVVKK